MRKGYLSPTITLGVGMVYIVATLVIWGPLDARFSIGRSVVTAAEMIRCYEALLCVFSQLCVFVFEIKFGRRPMSLSPPWS